MTEDEAKTKWCPMARIYYGEGINAAAAINEPDGTSGLKANCIGSQCMMWVEEWSIRVDDSGRWVPMPPMFSRNDEAVDEYQKAKKVTLGRCGLTYKP